MKLGELLKDADALTYINAIRVTQGELKKEVTEMLEQIDYVNQAIERVQKLIRRSDNQYRLVVKLATKAPAIASEVSVSNEIDEDLEELMQDVE